VAFYPPIREIAIDFPIVENWRLASADPSPEKVPVKVPFTTIPPELEIVFPDGIVAPCVKVGEVFCSVEIEST
jgi:hypothetical protein